MTDLIQPKTKVKTFYSVVDITRTDDGNFNVAGSSLTNFVDKQINDWSEKTGARIAETPSSPRLSLYNTQDEDDTMFGTVTMALLYYEGAEQTHDPDRRKLAEAIAAVTQDDTNQAVDDGGAA